jgi:formate C-acetyltransferase
MKELLKDYCEAVGGFSNPRKGRFQSGFYSVDTHGFMGKLTGALPDGRLKGMALVNSLSPVQGADRLGPTAVIKSVTKPDHRLMGNGMVLDLKFHPGYFGRNNHRRAFKCLVDTYFELGGMEIQFNVVSRETLQKAQNWPQDYQDLIVRVSGFSAYFLTLDKVIQDEIIARTETS